MTTTQRHLRTVSAIALGALALLTTGCGQDGGAKGDDTANDAGKKSDQAFERRKCLRDQGLKVPEPKPGEDERGMSIDSGSLSKEQMEKALKSCAEKTGGAGAAQGPTQADKDKMLKYAQCMRKNGFNMPDPKFEGGGMSSAQRVPEGAEKAKFDKANKACGDTNR
ncbi:hypothetical protein ABT160_39620 [Streptomyces sp. NPDC001941]|uniref:hypothetical protein n=1 Tax=Streptomyces sp. NPDC001941 TaxID=3154659 RepID=UPI003321C3F9